MKFRLKQKTVTAVQWKGWPHNIKGLEDHHSYPQLAQLGDGLGDDVYPEDWIVTSKEGKFVMRDWEFKKTYEKI